MGYGGNSKVKALASTRTLRSKSLAFERFNHQRLFLAIIQTMRLVNAIMVGVAVIVGAIVSAGSILEIRVSKLMLGFLTGFTISGASMVINDIMDINIDRVNAPRRPLVSGLLSVKDAWLIFLGLSMIGLTCSVLLGLKCFIVALFSFLTACSYSLFLKRTGLLGNAIVSINTAIPLLFGGLIAKGVNIPLTIFIAMVFLANMGREIVKGIADIEGDSKAGVRTLAVLKGPRYAAKVATLFVTGAVVLSPVPFFLSFAGIPYILLVSIADALLLYSVRLILRECDRIPALRSKRLMLIAMAIGLLSFALSTL